MNNLSIVILAGGMGTRMKSTLPKCLHCVKNIPMITRIINKSLLLKPTEIIILCSPLTYKLTKKIVDHDFRLSEIYIRIRYEIQPLQLGTGHAVLYGIQNIKKNNNVLILLGDAPTITFKTLNKMIQNNNPKLLISYKKNPYGCGRIIMKNNKILKIVEEKDCNLEEKKVNLVNTGTFFCSYKLLSYLLSFLKDNNKQKEYYLTDIIEITQLKNKQPFTIVICKEVESMNVNDREQLQLCEKFLEL